MFRKGDIVRRIGEEELFTVIKVNVSMIRGYNTLNKPQYWKSVLHMHIKPIGDIIFPGEIIALISEYEHVMCGKKKIKPHSFL